MSQPVPAGCPLTARQFEVMRLICEGLTYREIAQRIDRSVSAVRSRCVGAMTRLGVRESRQAVVVFMRHGWHTGVPAEPVYARGPITPWQAAYLHEFDRHLAGESDARARMSLALMGLGVRPRADRETARVPDRLLRALTSR